MKGSMNSVVILTLGKFTIELYRLNFICGEQLVIFLQPKYENCPLYFSLNFSVIPVIINSFKKVFY